MTQVVPAPPDSPPDSESTAALSGSKTEGKPGQKTDFKKKLRLLIPLGLLLVAAGFGASVMHEPDILFLDEPTSGVDPLARRQFWKLIRDFAQRGTAILVTTHYLEEAENCNDMAFMVAGEIVAQGSPSDIKASQPGQLIELVSGQVQAASNLLKDRLEDWRVSIFGDRLHLVLDNPECELDQVQQWLKTENIDLQSVRPIPFSLEDAFIGIVQRAEQSPEKT